MNTPDTRDALIKELVGALAHIESVVRNCDVACGYCCCGDDMEKHPSPMSCGHSPVDMGEYQADLALTTALAALASAEEAGYGAE